MADKEKNGKNDASSKELSLHDGTHPVFLSRATQERLGCRGDVDVYPLEPLKPISMESIRKDLADLGDASDFTPLRELIEQSRTLEPLIVFDPSRVHGSEFLLCLSEDSKFGYLQAEEDELLKLLDKKKEFEYKAPEPGGWETLGSGKVIEGTWVKDLRSRIRLQVRRSVPRKQPLFSFSDRNVDDVKDGYVSCDSYEDPKPFQNVSVMDRGIQAVPCVVEGEAQTELKHPKNIGIEYEARVFDPEQVAELWKSEEMKKFLQNAEKIMQEVAQEPDIMGEFRSDVESFYKRDEVVVIEEKEFVHKVFFSDLVFTRDMRVTQVRWHPTLPDIVAMAVMEDKMYEEYLENLSQRLAMPNVLTVWSMKFPFFPQLLLRICDDVTKLEWHPNEPEILVGGCTNGQLQIWDIGEYLPKLKAGECTWDHRVFLNSQSDKLHLEEGFIPVLHWSAESDKDHSHLSRVEDLQWLPKTVWFSHDSAYPKKNLNENELQLISCDGDRSVLIWALRKPPSDSLSMEGDEIESEPVAAKAKAAPGWTKLKVESALPTPSSRDKKKKKKYSQAVGKYESLNKIWRPVHRICFLDPISKHEDRLFQVLITSINVIDRPDLLILTRKDSVTPVPAAAAPASSAAENKPPHQSAAPEAQEESKVVNETKKKKEEEEKRKEEERKRKSSQASDNMNYDADADDSEEEEEKEVVDPAQFALPTFLMAGTVFGAIFRVDLTKVKVDVETNDLICKVDWDVSVHDGPVTTMVRSPHTKHLLLTVGGYSWAIWNEGDVSSPVVLHYIDEDSLFTSAAWSLTQPHVLFFSDEAGKLQVWDLKNRKAEPFQSQDISGRAINAICPYSRQSSVAKEGDHSDEEEDRHFISVADETGTLHVLFLPKHLYSKTDHDMDDILEFVELQINKTEERKRLQQQRELQQDQPAVKTDKEEFEEERHVTWEEEDYMKGYFKREKQVLWNIYGNDWKSHVKYPDLPRKKFYVEERKRDSSEERHRVKEMAAKAKKKKGGSIFRNYTD